MVGLLFLGGVVGYVAFWFFIVKRARNRLEKFAAISLALLIPFWELPIGYANYRLHCSRDGGLRIFDRVSGSDSIFVEGLGCSPQQLIRAGFRTIECKSQTSSDVLAFTADNRGIERSNRTKATSQLQISSVMNQPVGWNVYRRDVRLALTNDKKLLAQHAEFYWNGLWWQVALFPNGGSVSHCHAGEDDQIWRIALKGSG
jgi:hypothetical protein